MPIGDGLGVVCDAFQKMAAFLAQRLLFRNINSFRFGLDAYSPETPIGLLQLSGEIQRQAAMIGYINAFLLSGIIAAAAVPLALFMQRAKTP